MNDRAEIHNSRQKLLDGFHAIQSSVFYGITTMHFKMLQNFKLWYEQKSIHYFLGFLMDLLLFVSNPIFVFELRSSAEIWNQISQKC